MAFSHNKLWWEPPAHKLAITLRFFATGDKYVGMGYGWRVAHNTISLLIREVCDAIIQEYGQEVVCLLSDPETWQQVLSH